MVIWYYSKRKLWMINNRSQWGTENAKAVVKSNASHPADLGANEKWLEFNMQTEQFGHSNMRCVRLTDAEKKKNQVDKIIVSGRLGYNRATNGTYIRGKKIHAGKSYYKHTQNDFTIRWFETKWVVDWRGLFNDNIGAAVCKEEVPEPWMCTIPWRIYDGKAKDKKWKFDTLVKMAPEVENNTFE